MKIYFDDPEYDGQFLRAVAYGPLGAQIGEAWAIAAQIKAGDAESWYNAWSTYAGRLYDLGVKSHAAGDRISARNAFLRASNYYRSAYIFMFALPVDPRVIDAYCREATSAFSVLSWESMRGAVARPGTEPAESVIAGEPTQ